MMASKIKLNLSHSLEKKLSRIIECPEESGLDISALESIYILGFNCGTVTSYVGLTTNYILHDSALTVLGVVFLKTLPEEQQIKSILTPIRDHYKSSTGTQINSYLIYHRDEESKKPTKKLFNLDDGKFSPEEPPIVTLADTKIHMHSARISVAIDISLPILDAEKKLKGQADIDAAIMEAKNELVPSNVNLHLEESNFSTKSASESKQTLESLYATLEVPAEVDQKGDYLPQMTKDERKKLHSRWRNRMKDQRAPLKFKLECERLSNRNESPSNYMLKIDDYFQLQVNDPVSICIKQICYLLRQKLELLGQALKTQRSVEQNIPIEENEVKSCTFKPEGVNHLIQAVYLIPDKNIVQFEKLRCARKQLHEAYLLPLDLPAVRYSQRVISADLKNQDEERGFLCNVHHDLADKSGVKGVTLHQIVRGTYTYHHYMQDRANDNGWGCAYRSLQTIISWFKHQGYIYSPDIELRAPAGAKKDDKSHDLRKKLSLEERVPTHEEIQQVLVDVGDKQPSFVGTKKWIGSQEVCFVLNHLFNLDSKIISVSSGGDLVYKARDLGQHFASQATPVMIGGGVLAHTIIGVDFNEKSGDIAFLILDPHYTGSEDLGVITKKGWCGWKKNSFWDKTAFYNLCLPQRPNEY